MSVDYSTVQMGLIDLFSYPLGPYIHPVMVYKQLRMEGFLIFSWEDKPIYEEAQRQLLDWIVNVSCMWCLQYRNVCVLAPTQSSELTQYSKGVLTIKICIEESWSHSSCWWSLLVQPRIRFGFSHFLATLSACFVMDILESLASWILPQAQFNCNYHNAWNAA